MKVPFVVPFYQNVDVSRTRDDTLPATPSASRITAPTTMAVRVELRYDDYPEETNWKLTDTVTSVILFESASYTVPKALVSTEISDLVPGRSYSFDVRDAAHDGICCTYGRGSVKILLLRQGPEIVEEEASLLLIHTGNFGTELHATITLPHA